MEFSVGKVQRDADGNYAKSMYRRDDGLIISQDDSRIHGIPFWASSWLLIRKWTEWGRIIWGR